MSRTIGSSRSTMIGASPKLSSSTSSTLGSDTNARAIASICCSPPDNSPALRRASGCKAGKSASARSRASRRAVRSPVKPRRMFSSTVKSKNSERSSGTCATPRRGSMCGRTPTIVAPSTSTRPEIGARRPESVSKVVVLPAPFGPRSATTSPAPTVRDRSRTIGTPP